MELNKTLIELLGNDYIGEIAWHNEWYFFIEGVTELEEPCNCVCDNYDINNIDAIAVELIYDDEMFESIGILPKETPFSKVMEIALSKLKNGYKTITGLDNVDDFTVDGLLDYLAETLEE